MAGRENTALALLSASVTAAQIALMQLLACMQWHHFAHLVVAVALLGFGASGTCLSLARERLLGSRRPLVAGLMLAAAIGFIATPAALRIPALRFDLPQILAGTGQSLRLAGACLVLAMQFFCAGLATSLILVSRAALAGPVYSANLLGAGAGALAGLGLGEWVAPAPAMAGAASAALAGSALLLSERHGPAWSVMLLAVTLGGLRFGPAASAPAMSPFKDLARTLDLPGARVVASDPSAQGWLQIVDAPALRAGPPVDLAFNGRVPRQLAAFIDGNRAGTILADGAQADARAIFAASPESLPWRLRAPRTVLLVLEGAGGEAEHALGRGAGEVTLVQPHRSLAEFIRARWSREDRARVLADEPRLVLARLEGDVDLIRLPTVGALGGSAGLRAVSEDMLLTREGIAAVWHALSDEGLCLVTAWMDHPERTPLRLLATLVAGLEAAGAGAPDQHIAAVRGWAGVTVLVSRRAWTEADVRGIRSFCGDHGFDPLVLPGGVDPMERAAHHAWNNAGFFASVDAVLRGAEPADPTLRRLFRIEAPTDDRPYFAQFLRLGSIRALVAARGWRGMPYVELGSLIVAITLLVLTCLASALIVLPLVPFGTLPRSGRASIVGYFGALGAGFMMLEIVLMQRLTTVAGGAVPAAALVIGTLLVTAGCGSAWSQRLAPSRRTLVRITAAAALGCLVLDLGSRLLPTGWDAARPLRAAACALAIAPLGWVLGMAFPSGLRALAINAPDHLPWAWAVNGCVSVITPSLAMLLGVTLGHTAVFVLAAAAYALAALAAGLGRRPVART